MDKIQMAHDWAMQHGKSDTFGERANMVRYAWAYADAMQAESDKRKPSGLPEALCEVDWRVAPENTFQWQMINNEAYWRIEIMGGLDTEPAPTFGFTGSHIMERPHGF